MSNCYFTINSERNFFAKGDRWDPLENEGERIKPGIKQYHNKFIGFFRWLFGNAYWIKNKTTKTSIFIVKDSWKKWRERNHPQENYTIHTFVNEIREKLSKPINVIPVPPKVETIPLVDIKKEVGEVCDWLMQEIDDFIALGYEGSLSNMKEQIEQLRQGSQINEEPFKTWLVINEGDTLQKRCLVLPQMLQRHLNNLIVSQASQKAKIQFNDLIPSAPLMTHLNKVLESIQECRLLLKEWLQGNLSESKLKQLKENLKSFDLAFNADHPRLENLREALRLSIIDQETFNAFILSYKSDLSKNIGNLLSNIPHLKKAALQDKDTIEKSFTNSYLELRENLKKLDMAKTPATLKELQDQIKALESLNEPIESTLSIKFSNVGQIAAILPKIEAWESKHPTIIGYDLEPLKKIIKNTQEYIDITLETDTPLKPLLKELKSDLNILSEDPLSPRDRFTGHFLTLIPLDKDLEEITSVCSGIFPGIFHDLNEKYYFKALSKTCSGLPQKLTELRNQKEKENIFQLIEETIKQVSCFEGILLHPAQILIDIDKARKIKDPEILKRWLFPYLEFNFKLTPAEESTKRLLKCKFIWAEFKKRTLESFKEPFHGLSGLLIGKINALKTPHDYTAESFLEVADNYQKTVTSYKENVKKFQLCYEVFNETNRWLTTALTLKEDWLEARKPVIDYLKAVEAIQDYPFADLKRELESYKDLFNAPTHPVNTELFNTLKYFYPILLRFLNLEIPLETFIASLHPFQLPIAIQISKYPTNFSFETPEWGAIRKARRKHIRNEIKKSFQNFDLLKLKDQILDSQEVNQDHLALLRKYIFDDGLDLELLEKTLEERSAQITLAFQRKTPPPQLLLDLIAALGLEVDQFFKYKFTNTHETISILKKLRSELPLHSINRINFEALLLKWEDYSVLDKMSAKGMRTKIDLLVLLTNFW